MKVIVTGGCGFIGRHLIPRLIQMGEDVTVLDNKSTGSPENLANIDNQVRLTIINSDIAQPGTWDKEFIDADRVVHLAALTDIVASIESPTEYFSVNVRGTLNVLEACRRSGIKRLVYPASAACYGTSDQYPTPEDAPMRPQYPYALTKQLGEELVLHWAKVYGLSAVSLRFFNIYGPHASAMFGLFISQIRAGQPITITGDGSQTRDFTYISDIVDAIVAALQSNQTAEAYNIGSGTTVSVRRFAELLGSDIKYIPRRRGEMDVTFGDISKALRELDWKPRISVEEGIRLALSEMKM